MICAILITIITAIRIMINDETELNVQASLSNWFPKCACTICARPEDGDEVWTSNFEDFNGDPGGGLSDNMKTMIMIHDFYRKGEISTQLTVK